MTPDGQKNLLSETAHPAARFDWATKDPLEFLIRFVQADLPSQTEGQWLDLAERLRWFLFQPTTLGPISLEFVSSVAEAERGRPSAAMCAQVQDQLREVVRAFASWHMPVWERAVNPTMEEVKRFFAPDGARNVQIAIRTEMESFFGGVVIVLHADPIWIACLQARLVLHEHGAGRVRECSECGRLFVRVRRQVHCSAKCRNTASMRTYLANQEKRLRHRDSSHRTYAKKKRAEIRAKVKVIRRPRKGR